MQAAASANIGTNTRRIRIQSLPSKPVDSAAQNGPLNHPHEDTSSMKAKNLIDHYAP
jgi:hypothetical protein